MGRIQAILKLLGDVPQLQIARLTNRTEAMIRQSTPRAAYFSWALLFLVRGAMPAGWLIPVARLVLVAGTTVLASSPAPGQQSGQSQAADAKPEAPQSESPQYSDAVAKKAEAILAEAGLKQSGRSIIALESFEISRAISELSRQRRELRLVQKEWQTLNQAESALRQELQRLNAVDGQLNLQLAQQGTLNVARHNQYVAQINANRARMKGVNAKQSELKSRLAAKRSELNKAEAAYAESVLAIRNDLKKLAAKLSEALTDQKVQIALRVMAQNFQTPQGLSASDILTPVDGRLEKVEQEIFSESIPLDVEENGSLYAPVVVDGTSIRMIVDSGATLVSLPARTAAELGIKVPADAPQIRMVMADGRVIAARGVTLDRVRVGAFEAENVAAAVLDESAPRAEPLLGMSFLSHFKFEVDTAEKTLKMLRVAAE